MDINDAIGLAITEMLRATNINGPFNSAHEGYAVMKEELEELWDEVKTNNKAKMREEATQLAAMSIRFLMDICEIEYVELSGMTPD